MPRRRRAALDRSSALSVALPRLRSATAAPPVRTTTARPHRSRPIRRPRAELSPSRVPEQSRPRHGKRRGRAAASCPHSRVLRLLRLAFGRTRPLAAGTPGAPLPDRRLRSQARAELARSLTPQNIAGEVAFLKREDQTAFERPYGLAWLLTLSAELRQWNDPQAKQWLSALLPLETEAAAHLKSWLPKLHYPIRIGEHDQTAFSFGLVWDWAGVAGDTEMLEGIAHGLGRDDRRSSALLAAANSHRHAALPEVTGEHYEGGHWLGTFAVYLTESRRSMSDPINGPATMCLHMQQSNRQTRYKN